MRSPREPSKALLPVWLDYRSRRRLMWGVFLGYLPFALLATAVSSVFTKSETPAVGAALFWMALWGASVLRFTLFRCPRCGKLFHARRWGPSNPWARRCLNCGLPAFSDPSAPAGDA